MSKKRQRAVFIFEASADVGGGHAARCIALAGELARTYDLTIAANTSASPLLSHAPPHKLETWPDADPAASVRFQVTEPAFDLAVLDHYRLGAQDEHWLRARAARTLVIDDLADRSHDCDVLLDATPHGGASRYRALVDPACRVLAGADYALLRPEFRRARLRVGAVQAASARQRILVSMGATDPVDATSGVLSAIALLGTAIDVTVVLSGLAPHRAAVADLIESLPFATRLVCDPQSMADLYATHDICIGAPATSALERCCVGLPSLLVETADNQRDLSAALAASGACRVLGRQSIVTSETIRAETRALLSDTATRERMRCAGLRLIDGLGAPRTAANLSADFVTRQGAALIGRRLRREDSDVLMAWNCEPGTRAFSRTACAPTPEEHATWIDRRLESRTAVTEIIEESGKPVAIARLDSNAEGLEVSIVVAPDRRGEGIGGAAIGYLDRLAGDAPCVAWVHPSNVASRALFHSCGYRNELGASRQLQYLDLEAIA